MFWVLPFKTISLPYYYRCWVTTIDVARIFRNVWIRPRGPRCTGLLGGHLGTKGAPLAINMGPILLHGDLAGEWVLIVGPWHLQVLSWLQDASAMATPTWQVRGPGRWGGEWHWALRVHWHPLHPTGYVPGNKIVICQCIEISTLRKVRLIYERYKHTWYLATRKRLISIFFGKTVFYEVIHWSKVNKLDIIGIH